MCLASRFSRGKKIKMFAHFIIQVHGNFIICYALFPIAYSSWLTILYIYFLFLCEVNWLCFLLKGCIDCCSIYCHIPFWIKPEINLGFYSLCAIVSIENQFSTLYSAPSLKNKAWEIFCTPDTFHRQLKGFLYYFSFI